MLPKGLFILLWVFAIHLAGLYLYTRGFLLTRLALSELNSCSSNACVPPKHKRAILLIIDALRFDFISPDTPSDPSPYYHNVLTLPAELTAAHPARSLLLHSYADPPTTTLQRIKGITTGSLPTFVDMGSNFGGSSILEDSIIGQLNAAGKKVAFMGDDTWMSVFPSSFDQKYPFDSFNVEDLHTVDEGVIRHLFPLLNETDKSWDFIIGHFLGVDHVGHRLGPEHPIMKTKLEQMDNVLRKVVQGMDDDTLLVLMGDHGMDNKGDHGGDSELEVSAGMWIYSKKHNLSDTRAKIPSNLLKYHTFPASSVPSRSVQQIDLVPSLSLLLGLPIPFNNLGTVIPELFWDSKDGKRFKNALEINSVQVKRYLEAYRNSPSGAELDADWDELQTAWDGTSVQSDDKWTNMNLYTRFALSVCRALWAQFNVSLMSLGLTVLCFGVLSSVLLYHKLGAESEWDTWTQNAQRTAFLWAGIGGLTGIVASVPLTSMIKGVGLTDYTLFGAAISSTVGISLLARPPLSLPKLTSFPLLLLLHALAFLSNSYILWEDKSVTYLLLSSLVPSVFVGFTAPTSRLRIRILGFSVLFAVCVRLMAISTICREEQQPYCHVTFFASSSITVPPTLVLALSLPASIGLPFIARRFLQFSKSDRGIALLLTTVFPLLGILTSAVWLLEWMDVIEVLGPGWSGVLRTVRTATGWLSLSSLLVFVVWWQVPLCLEIKVEDSKTNTKKQVTVIGFANSFGSPYIILWLIFLSLVQLSTQLTGQIILTLGAVALFSYLEIIDSVRDVRTLNAAFQSSNPSSVLQPSSFNTPQSIPLRFSEIVPIALLAIHAFYGTGHQSTISSIQWKSAFVLTPSLTYPFSPALVLFNTCGPIFIFAFAVPLLALWNVTPLPHPSTASIVRKQAIRASLGIMIYFGILLLSSSISSAWLRRHLMVWKVFSPRFMYAAGSLLVVDVAVILGVLLGVTRIVNGLDGLFRRMPAMDGVGEGHRKTQKTE
ncbi:hypothetical protein C8Q75DRAFT_744129 [Abortiporus biennis]|nr:hypothetical protein C8Q75DRAFT_744129 [Abortiporus biennis]